MVSIEGYAVSELVYAVISVYVFIFILVGARIFEDKVKGRSMKRSLFIATALMALSFIGLLLPLRIGSVLIITGALFGWTASSVWSVVSYVRQRDTSRVYGDQQMSQQGRTRDFIGNQQQYPPQQYYPHQQQSMQPQQQQRPMTWQELQQQRQHNGNQNRYNEYQRNQRP